MRPDFHVVTIAFYDTPERLNWHPDDPYDCEVWATVAVGDDSGTAYFNVHICTPEAIRRIKNKRCCFTIDEFRGVQDLIQQLDAFIEQRVPGHMPGDPFRALSKYWEWEYEGM